MLLSGGLSYQLPNAVMQLGCCGLKLGAAYCGLKGTELRQDPWSAFVSHCRGSGLAGPKPGGGFTTVSFVVFVQV